MSKLAAILTFSLITVFSFSCKKSETTVSTTETKDSVIVENTIPPVDTVSDMEVDITTVSGTFNIDNPSTVNWTGSNPTSNHVGTVNISKGSLELKNGTIIAGTFDIDMNSILSTDLKSEDGKEKLENHLKSPDFFDVKKYPTAVFTLVKSVLIKGTDKTRHHMKGDLKIKDITKQVEFDAYIIASDNGNYLTATTPNFEINRVDYGIKYNSGVINTVKDKIISDKVGLVINIRAKK